MALYVYQWNIVCFSAVNNKICAHRGGQSMQREQTKLKDIHFHSVVQERSV